MGSVTGFNFSPAYSYAVSRIGDPGALEEVEAGWAFNKYVRIGLAAGFGKHDMADSTPYFIPLLINGTFRTPEYYSVSLFAKAGLGLNFYADTISRTIYMGPLAALTLGAEVRAAAGFYIALYTKLLTGVITSGGTELLLSYVPVGLSLRYEF